MLNQLHLFILWMSFIQIFYYFIPHNSACPHQVNIILKNKYSPDFNNQIFMQQEVPDECSKNCYHQEFVNPTTEFHMYCKFKLQRKLIIILYFSAIFFGFRLNIDYVDKRNVFKIIQQIRQCLYSLLASLLCVYGYSLNILQNQDQQLQYLQNRTKEQDMYFFGTFYILSGFFQAISLKYIQILHKELNVDNNLPQMNTIFIFCISSAITSLLQNLFSNWRYFTIWVVGPIMGITLLLQFFFLKESPIDQIKKLNKLEAQIKREDQKIQQKQFFQEGDVKNQKFEELVQQRDILEIRFVQNVHNLLVEQEDVHTKIQQIKQNINQELLTDTYDSSYFSPKTFFFFFSVSSLYFGGYFVIYRLGTNLKLNYYAFAFSELIGQFIWMKYSEQRQQRRRYKITRVLMILAILSISICFVPFQNGDAKIYEKLVQLYLIILQRGFLVTVINYIVTKKTRINYLIPMVLGATSALLIELSIPKYYFILGLLPIISSWFIK
ncbi:hypothetical protein pb186bvf_013749 [Paramecium bursaria]